MISVTALNSKDRKLVNPDSKKEIYLHTGIVGRGLCILSNYLLEADNNINSTLGIKYGDNINKFYDVCTKTELFEGTLGLIINFKMYSAEIENDYIDFVYSNFASAVNNVCYVVGSLPFDVIESILNSYGMILDPSNMQNDSSDKEDYEYTVSMIYTSLAQMFHDQTDACIVFIEGKNQLKFMYKVAKECLESQTEISLD